MQRTKQTDFKTTYKSLLHFSQTNTGRMCDKVMQLLENDLSAKKL